jgi:hypothetical protein
MDSYGFKQGSERSGNPNGTQLGTAPSTRTQSTTPSNAITSKENEWLGILEGFNKNNSSWLDRRRVKKLCRKGIPDSLRAKVWFLLVGNSSNQNLIL